MKSGSDRTTPVMSRMTIDSVPASAAATEAATGAAKRVRTKRYVPTAAAARKKALANLKRVTFCGNCGQSFHSVARTSG